MMCVCGAVMWRRHCPTKYTRHDNDGRPVRDGAECVVYCVDFGLDGSARIVYGLAPLRPSLTAKQAATSAHSGRIHKTGCETHPSPTLKHTSIHNSQTHTPPPTMKRGRNYQINLAIGTPTDTDSDVEQVS